MVVVDASALVDLLLVRPAADALADLVFGAGDVIAAPHLIDPEVLQTLRRLLRVGKIDGRQADAALDLFPYIVIERHPHHVFRQRIWFLRNNLTPMTRPMWHSRKRSMCRSSPATPASPAPPATPPASSSSNRIRGPWPPSPIPAKS